MFNRFVLAAAAAAALASGSAQAVTIAYSSVTGTAGVNHVENAADGVFPADWHVWADDALTAYWTGDSEYITFAFDQAYSVTGLTLTVDNNDFYRVQLSTDGSAWVNYDIVLAFEGTVGGGVETFVRSVPATAPIYRFARVTAFFGDGSNSVGEVQFSGVAAVPEVDTTAMLAAGLGALALLRRRRG